MKNAGTYYPDTGENEFDLAPQQHDCEDRCGKCYTCLNKCCPNCLSLLVTIVGGPKNDESYRKCPDCKYGEHT